MKLIVGLGNPGVKYQKNRHNLGFMVVDEFAKSQGFSWKYSQDFMGYFIKQEEYILLKPQTFMNRSGESIKNVSTYFRIPHEDILVVHDDLDLPFGGIRLAFNGLSAGHHGIDSIIKALGTVDFNRVRIGIGRPQNIQESSSYVLEDFKKEEAKELTVLIKKCETAIDSYLLEGIQATMNRFN